MSFVGPQEPPSQAPQSARSPVAREAFVRCSRRSTRLDVSGHGRGYTGAGTTSAPPQDLLVPGLRSPAPPARQRLRAHQPGGHQDQESAPALRSASGLRVLAPPGLHLGGQGTAHGRSRCALGRRSEGAVTVWNGGTEWGESRHWGAQWPAWARVKRCRDSITLSPPIPTSPYAALPPGRRSIRWVAPVLRPGSPTPRFAGVLSPWREWTEPPAV